MADPTYSFGTQNEGASDPADDYVVVTPSSTDLVGGPCKAILCSADGVLNLKSRIGGVRVNIPVQKGYNPLRAVAIDNPSAGTAPTTVVALY
jgi:hypothetical protein